MLLSVFHVLKIRQYINTFNKFGWLFVLLNLFYWIVLWCDIDLANYFPFWFWRQTETPLPRWWLIFLVFMGCLGLIHLIKKQTYGVLTKLVAIILTAVFIQHAFGLMEGRGINGIRDRMLHTGHAEFAKEAIRQKSMLYVARNYQHLIETGQLAFYPNATKPPGQLLIYILTERMSRLFIWSNQTPLLRMATFASFLYPLLTYLTIIPLFFISKLYLTQKETFIPLLIFITLPNVTLISLHLDQCLFPLLFTVALALFLCGFEKDRPLFFLFSGIMTSISIFISFSMTALLPLMALILLIEYIKKKDTDLSKHEEETNNHLVHISIKALLYWVSGFLLFQLAVYIFFNYNFIQNYNFAVTMHKAWKIKAWSPQLFFYIGFLNIFEFAVWTSIPLFGLAITCMIKSGYRFNRLGKGEIIGFSFLILFLALAFFGKTVAETARLWIFLTPMLAMLGTMEITNHSYVRSSKWQIVTIIITIQVLGTLFTKRWQDFF